MLLGVAVIAYRGPVVPSILTVARELDNVRAASMHMVNRRFGLEALANRLVGIMASAD
jgi:hypothetical protein